MGTCLGSKCTSLHEWLLVEDAFLIKVLSSINIVNCTYDKVKIIPCLISEDVLSGRANEVGSSSKLNIRIVLESCLYCDFTLLLIDVFFSEEELSV